MKKYSVVALTVSLLFTGCAAKNTHNEEKDVDVFEQENVKTPKVEKKFSVIADVAKERLNEELQTNAHMTGEKVTLYVTLYDNGYATCQYGSISPSSSGQYDFVCWGEGYRYYFDTDEMIISRR